MKFHLALGLICVLMHHFCIGPRFFYMKLACSPELKPSYSTIIKETDPQNTQLQFKVDVEQDGDSWSLQVVEPNKSEVKIFLTNAFQFDQSPDDDQPLKCVHGQPRAHGNSFCILQLKYAVDAEEIYKKFHILSPFVIQFNATCRTRDSAFHTTLNVTLQPVNEFAPEFAKNVVTARYPKRKLLKGFRLYNLSRIARDRDVGDTCVFSMDNDTSLVAIEHDSLVILQKDLTDQVIPDDTGLRFVFRITNPGPTLNPVSQMTLVLRERPWYGQVSLLSSLSSMDKIVYFMVIPLGVVFTLCVTLISYNCVQLNMEKRTANANRRYEQRPAERSGTSTSGPQRSSTTQMSSSRMRASGSPSPLEDSEEGDNDSVSNAED